MVITAIPLLGQEFEKLLPLSSLLRAHTRCQTSSWKRLTIPYRIIIPSYTTLIVYYEVIPNYLYLKVIY